MYGLLLLAGIFAAWQAHELWRSVKEAPDAPVPRRTEPRTLGSGLAKIRQLDHAVSGTMPSAQSGPATAPWDPLAESEVQVVPRDEDPVGMVPPTGAIIQRAHRAPDGALIANYEWTGVLAEAARHYEKVFEEEGYKAMPSTTDERGWHYLSFEGKGWRFVVVLRSAGRDGKIVSIDVTVIPLSR